MKKKNMHSKVKMSNDMNENKKKNKTSSSQTTTKQKQLIFIRHGKSQAQEAAMKGLDRDNDTSLLDCGLANLGIDQAHSLRPWFEQQFDPKDVFILCSPLKRALQTALIAFPDHPNIQVHPNLIETPGTLPENTSRPLSKLTRDPDLNTLPGWESIDWSGLPDEWPDNNKRESTQQKDTRHTKQISKKKIREQIRREVLDVVSSCKESTVILVCHYNVIRSYFPKKGFQISNCVPYEAHLSSSSSDLKLTDDDTQIRLEFIGINKI